MRNFTNVKDIGSLDLAVKEALEVKANRFAYQHLGKNKTLMMIFFQLQPSHTSQHPESSHESRHECHRSRRKSGCMEA